jgi:hypothetical protein
MPLVGCRSNGHLYLCVTPVLDNGVRCLYFHGNHFLGVPVSSRGRSWLLLDVHGGQCASLPHQLRQYSSAHRRCGGPGRGPCVCCDLQQRWYGALLLRAEWGALAPVWQLLWPPRELRHCHRGGQVRWAPIAPQSTPLDLICFAHCRTRGTVTLTAPLPDVCTFFLAAPSALLN